MAEGLAAADDALGRDQALLRIRDRLGSQRTRIINQNHALTMPGKLFVTTG